MNCRRGADGSDEFGGTSRSVIMKRIGEIDKKGPAMKFVR